MGYSTAVGAPHDFKATRGVDFNKAITAQDKDPDTDALTDKDFTDYSGVGEVRESYTGRKMVDITVALTTGLITLSIADTLLDFKAGKYVYTVSITTDTGKIDRYLKGEFILYN